jgi:hypothetical protein
MDFSMKELDEVVIPHHISIKSGVVELGTIVWYVCGADYATVECAVVGDNPEGIQTKLIDVDINDLRLSPNSGDTILN